MYTMKRYMLGRFGVYTDIEVSSLAKLFCQFITQLDLIAFCLSIGITRG